jgi:nicotinamide-nucleotide amidase
MPTAEIITIGTELLLGEIVDTNAPFIARVLRDAGINLHRKTTVGDNTNRIAQVLQEAMQRADIIITTGGLGPTVDDPTREAVAMALGVETFFSEELWEQIKDRFRRYGREPTENNKRQAYLPVGADAIENPVGTAPSFVYETGRNTIFSIPGVPREMEYLMAEAVMPYLLKRFNLVGIIKSRTLHTSGVGESQIDDLIGDLEKLSNPTVGMAAHSGQVDIRITAKAGTAAEADQMIREVENEVLQRIGKWVYGADHDTLEQVTLNAFSASGWTLAILEIGLNGTLAKRLATAEGPFVGSKLVNEIADPEELPELVRQYRQEKGVDAVLGVALFNAGVKHDLHWFIATPEGEKQHTRSFGGPPALAITWSVNICLDFLRKLNAQPKDKGSARS